MYMHVCVYACMCVCVYVCMCVSVFVHMRIVSLKTLQLQGPLRPIYMYNGTLRHMHNVRVVLAIYIV